MISSTIAAGLFVTVPLFGDGIRPFGPSTLACRPRSAILSGLAIKTSKSSLPLAMSAKIFSALVLSAPAFLASSASFSPVMTAIFTVLPVPAGKGALALRF